MKKVQKRPGGKNVKLKKCNPKFRPFMAQSYICNIIKPKYKPLLQGTNRSGTCTTLLLLICNDIQNMRRHIFVGYKAATKNAKIKFGLRQKGNRKWHDSH